MVPNGEAIGVELRVKAEVQGARVRTYTLIHEMGEAWAVRKGLAQLALTDPLCKYVTDCPPQWAPVTIDHLARHSSGVPDYEEPLELGSERYLSYMVVTGNADSIIAAAKTKPLDFPPGTKFQYSNTGYILLAVRFLEERDLLAQFGSTYRTYQQEVPMLLPRLGRRKQRSPLRRPA